MHLVRYSVSHKGSEPVLTTDGGDPDCLLAAGPGTDPSRKPQCWTHKRRQLIGPVRESYQRVALFAAIT